jgi:cobalt-zinc-cadmium efflux system outer membrane protein
LDKFDPDVLIAVRPICTSLPHLIVLALAITGLAGCATARNDLNSIKNPGAPVESAALPADIVRKPAKEPGRPQDDPHRQSSEIVLTSAEEVPRSPAPDVDRDDDDSGGQKLEKRLRMPDKLPGSRAQDLSLPRDPDLRHAVLEKLFPSMADPPAMNQGPAATTRPRVSLTELEQMALANSPIVPQYESDVTGAVGSAIQAGTHPNPIFGYESDTVGSSQNRDYQGIYMSQIIKTAGKLEVAQAIENVDLMNSQLMLRQARNELISQARRQYFALLIARESMEINEAIVGFTYAVYRIQVDQVMLGGQAAAFEPMQLRTFVEQSRAALVAARNRYIAAWEQLRSTLNAPDLPLADLADDPDLAAPLLDYDAAISHVLSMNTEIRAARNGPIRARLSLRLAEITPIPDVYAYITVQKDFTTPGLPHASYNTQFGVPVPVFDRNRGNILTAQAFLVRATQEVPRVQNDLRSRLADAFERFETNRFQVGVSRDQILPDSVRTYRGTYARHSQEPDIVGFADVVVAQQNMLLAVSQYISALNAQWAAFVDIAALLQVESLKELSLRLLDAPAAPPAAESPDGKSGVGSMMAQLLKPPETVAPISTREKAAGVKTAPRKQGPHSDLLIPEEDIAVNDSAVASTNDEEAPANSSDSE